MKLCQTLLQVLSILIEGNITNSKEEDVLRHEGIIPKECLHLLSYMLLNDRLIVFTAGYLLVSTNL